MEPSKPALGPAYEEAGVSEGTPLAAAVLAVVNDAKLTTTDYVVGVRLPSHVGLSILQIRVGTNNTDDSVLEAGDGISSTRFWRDGGDDHRFERLSELDQIPEIDARAFELLKVFAMERGYFADPGVDLQRLSAGAHHSCGVKPDARVICWGHNAEFRATPLPGTFRHVSAGQTHTCGLRTDGTPVCWGKGFDSSPSSTTHLLGSKGSIRQISVGTRTCGIKTDGTLVYMIGFMRKVPQDAFKQVSAGTGFSDCGVKLDGTVACWDQDDSAFVKLIPPPGTFKAVSTGDWHACGVKTDGTIACWTDSAGRGNEHGQATPPTGTFQHVSSGASHTCGVRTDGTVACWGDNTYGQSSAPPGTFQQVSAGERHTCGLKLDGGYVCWGDNKDGQTAAPNPTP